VAALLVVAFLLVPVVEIYVIIQVGQEIGAVPTVVLLVLESLLGAWIVTREGRSAWTRLREATYSGRLPGRELADAALVLVGGTLLLTPGFITDIVGFFCVLPPTRPLARRALIWLVARRAARVVGRSTVTFTTMSRGGTPGQSRPESGRVVRGETVQNGTPGDGPAGSADPHTKGPGRATGG
jgi:UPF0716 protein FxsA